MSMCKPFNRRARRSAARSHKGRRALVAVGLLAVLTTVAQAPVGAAPPPDKADAAREIVARKTGQSAAALEVLGSSTAEYPRQGKSAAEVKLLDRRTGTVHSVTLDAKGQELDQSALRADEAAAVPGGRGRLHPALAQRLDRANPAERIPVIIWLKEPAYTAPTRPANLSSDQADAFLKFVDERRAAAVARVNGPAASSVRGLGHDAKSDPYAPALYVDLPAAAVTAIADRLDADTVYLNDVNEGQLDISRPTINATPLNAAGLTGTGVQVGVIEVGGRVATANPNLAGIVQDGTSVCASVSGHSTAVAGMVRSTHATHKGIAAGANVRAGGSCSGFSSELQSRSTAAADWGASALNLSWGADLNLVPGANDRFYDTMAITRYRTVVAAAGNHGTTGCVQGTSGNVLSPGLAYNILTVGNFDDKNSVAWAGDTMAACSSWRDPKSTHSDREEPDVSAPGTNINSTTTASPWVGGTGSGTSYAAPMVTGTVALLMQKDANLKVWPEAVRAIVQATAVHNIEGASRLSEFDGAGGLDALRASYAAGKTNGSGWGAKSYDCAQPASQDVQTVTLTAGKRARVAIAWDNDPAFTGYASAPSADLDLQVLNAAGASVATSTSWDNTYEIVDFTPTVTGAYRIRVNKHSCAFSPRYLGWAWSNA